MFPDLNNLLLFENLREKSGCGTMQVVLAISDKFRENRATSLPSFISYLFLTITLLIQQFLITFSSQLRNITVSHN